MTNATVTTIPIESLDAFVRGVLVRAGMSAADAATTAQLLALADAMGVHTHGTKLLAGYVRKLLAGGYRPDGVPRVVREGPGWAVVDGDSALGQVGSSFALRLAVAKAKITGTACVGLNNTGHIGAAGGYAVMAARAGMLAVVVGNDLPSVAAPGSRHAVLGSNPLAWAAPVPDGEPILLDIATAAVAGGKVYAAVQRGEAIDPTWLIGTDGRPTTDGRLYPHAAALAPMAGHKGYGIAMLAEVLSGVLAGGAITTQVGNWIFGPAETPTRHNAGFIVVDIETIAGPDAYRAGIARLVAGVREAPAAEDVARVMLPGDREWENHRRAVAGGIALPADVRAKLSEVAAAVGVAPPS
jgi:LDH2 family malate/lactate/ureidoglycolate dehydrogenase